MLKNILKSNSLSKMNKFTKKDVRSEKPIKNDGVQLNIPESLEVQRGDAINDVKQLLPLSPNTILVEELKASIETFSEEQKLTDINLFELQVRSCNVLHRENIQTFGELLETSNNDILRWKGCGKKTINDLKSAVQKIGGIKLSDSATVALEGERLNWVKSYLKGHYDQKPIFDQNGITDEVSYLRIKDCLEADTRFGADEYRYEFFLAFINKKNPVELLKIIPSWLLEMDVIYFECDRRLKNILSYIDIKLIADLSHYNMANFRRLPNMGIKSVASLAECLIKAQKKGPPPSRIKDTLPSKNHFRPRYKNLGEAFFTSLKKITNEKYKFVLEQRLGVFGPIKTLEEIAQVFGLTRERVRQIQVKVIRNIIDGEFWDDYLKLRVSSVLKDSESPVYMDELSENDSWLAGFEGNELLLKNVIIYFSHLEPKFLEHGERTILCNISNEEWDKLKSELLGGFEYSLGLQYTIEDIEMIIENRMADFESKELTSLMLNDIYPALNFSSSSFDMILSSIGNSVSTHLIALLNEAPEPLHFSKIRDIYEERYGVNVSARNVHARLSYGNFLLFGRGTYGTKKHLLLSEEDQKGVMGEAEKFLEGHAYKQCHSHEILKSIDAKRINKFILNIILLQSEKVTYLGKMVWIYGNKVEENERLPIKETVASILKKKGRSMRIEELEKEISKVRSVGAHFSVNLQPNELFSRVNPAIWGLLERDFILSEKKWRAIKDHLFDYFTKSRKALHTSEFNKIVQKLDIDKKITVGHIVGVLSSDDRFRKWRGGFVGLASWDTPQRITLDEAIDIVLEKCANGSFSLEAIEMPLKEVLGHDFEKYRVATHLNKKGYEYNRDNNLWDKAAKDYM